MAEISLVLGSRPASAVHEILHFLQGNCAIVVGIHGPEDTLLSRLKLLQRNRPVTISVHQTAFARQSGGCA
jgi:hypothetical protein